MGRTAKVIGAGIGLAAVALGQYFLTGRRGEKNRAAIRGWMLKMKGEVLERVEKLRELTREDYERIVDETADSYKRVKDVSAEELKRLTAELKEAWKHIKRTAAGDSDTAPRPPLTRVL